MMFLNEKFYYINNRWNLIEGGEVIADLYKSSDPEGIHLNPKGQEVLAKAWLSEVDRLSHMHFNRSVISDEGSEALTPTQ